MRYLLAIICPPLAILLCKRCIQFFICIALTCFYWIPGVIHAFVVVNKFYSTCGICKMPVGRSRYRGRINGVTYGCICANCAKSMGCALGVHRETVAKFLRGIGCGVKGENATFAENLGMGEA